MYLKKNLSLLVPANLKKSAIGKSETAGLILTGFSLANICCYKEYLRLPLF